MRFYLFNPIEKSVNEVTAHVWYSYAGRTDLMSMGNLVFTRRNDDTVVSTSFLGIDHNFSQNRNPHLFETMIFEGRFDGYTLRCGSYAEAKDNHSYCVNMLNRDKIEAETTGIQQELIL